MSGQTAEPPSGGSAPPVPIRRTKARGGAEMVVLGQGTSRMGLDPAYRKQEVAALRLGLDLGMSVIDTAEGYADGGAEQVVAEAIRGRRDETFLTTKVLPDNASRQGTTAALEDSLRRLGTDRIDLYMLHAESTTGALEAPHPLEETLEAFEQLVHEQKILHYGVNNFDTDAMQAIEQFGLGKHIAANQVLYNLTARGIERGLIDWCTERDVVVMVYMPIDKARLPARPALEQVARRHDVTPMCAAIAWTLRHPSVVAIPKARDLDHLRQNAAAATLELTEEDLAELDRDYPAPTHDVPLAMPY